MPRFSDINEIADWLDIRPDSVAEILALRAVTRALPSLGPNISSLAKTQTPDQVGDFSISVFWALSSVWTDTASSGVISLSKYEIISNYLFRSSKLARSNASKSFLHSLTLLIEAISAYKPSTLSNRKEFRELCAASAISSIEAIEEATRATTFAARRSQSGSSARLEALRALEFDADQIERQAEGNELLLSPLWPPKISPKWLPKCWDQMKASLFFVNEDWSVWTEWYDDRLYGDATTSPWIDTANITFDEEFWLRGPREVNAEIKRLKIEEEIDTIEIFDSNDKNMDWDFFVSYNKADEVLAREIVELLQEEGYVSFSQFKDFFPGSNFVSEMQRGLARSGRVIALYSPDYQSSAHCQAEWNAAYNSDPSGEKRKLVPFLLRPTELAPLARQIVYVSLVGLDREARRERILRTIRYSPPIRTNSEIRQALAEVASPDVTVSEGRLDAGPNSTFDRPFVDSDLANLPALQRSVANALLEALPDNCPRIVRSSLKGYEAELRDRGVQPIIGILQQLAGATEAEYGSLDSEVWGKGLASLFGSFFANNQLLLTHFPLREDRERLFSETPVDEDAASGPTLTSPTADVTKAVDDVVAIDKATLDFKKINEAISQMAKDIGSLPPSPPDQAQPSTTITPKRRYVLTTLGFYERVYAFIGSTASIASTPQGMALAEKLKTAIESLLRLLI